MILKTALIFLSLSFAILNAKSQNELRVLKSNSNQVSIQDGDILRKDYWYLDPSIELDVYEADKINKTKIVSFFSEIDTLSFTLNPHEAYDFIIVSPENDSCLTRLRSGLSFKGDIKPELISDTIPFVLTNDNNIIVEAIINDIDTLNLMFHTALNSISITEEAAKKMKSISLNDSVKGNSWGGTGNSRYSTNNTFEIGSFAFENRTIWENKNSGPKSDGKFGPHLFHDKVVELNFDKGLLIIHSTLPKIPNSFSKTDILFNQHEMYLRMLLLIKNDTLKHKALIHTGYAGNLLLDDVFTTENKLGKKLELTESIELKDSYGNSVYTQSAKVEQLSILQQRFDSLQISFFEGSIGRQHKSAIGSNIIKRFNLFFDLQKAKLYYKPNQLMDDK